MTAFATFVPAQQILVGAAGTLTWQPRGADGEPADPGAAVTVTVAASDGTVIAADAATSGTGTTERTYTLAARTRVDWLTATWKVAAVAVASTEVEIVGGYWFDVAAAVDADDKLADRAKYPTARLLAVRRDVEAEFEEHTGVAWVPRFASSTIAGTGTCTLILPHVALRTIRAVTAIDADGTETVFTVDELGDVTAETWGVLRSPSAWTAWRYRVDYEHGHDAPPADLRTAAITRLRHRLNMARSGIPDRATSMSTEAGQTYALATPGLRGFVTGIPDVDVVLDRYRFRRFGIA